MSSSQDPGPRPTVLLADDHAATAEQLCTLLRPHVEVLALVLDGRALVKAARELSPDVIVTDISMPGLDGLDAAALILRWNPSARIVLLTVHAEPILVARALETGVLGYVLKDSAGDELVAAITAALGDHQYVSRALGRRGSEGD